MTDLGGVLLIVERTVSAIAAGSRLPQDWAVSAAFVGGPPRRDAFDCGADCVRYRRGVAPPTGDLWCPLLLWEGPGGVPCPGAMLLIVGRALSAIAAGARLLQGSAVFQWVHCP